MRKVLGVLAAAGLMVLGAGTASAQGLDVRIGVGEPGYRVVQNRYERPIYRERVIERRRMRGPQARTVCRMVMRTHVRPSGRVVRRPVEVCRRVVTNRRVYVD